MENKICLIGFMGCGKTTISELLSKKLQKSYIDLDKYIEMDNKMSISDIFSTYGEVYFRNLENKALKVALNNTVEIISTGGGIITLEENINLLKNYNTFYLRYKFDTLYNRISGDSSRPLVTTYAELQNRYSSRISLYEKSSRYIIDCEDKVIDDILREILDILGRDKNK